MNLADILNSGLLRNPVVREYLDSLKTDYSNTLSAIAADPRKGLLGLGERINQGAREWNRDMMGQMGGLLSVRPEVAEQSMEGLLGTLPMPAGINAIRAYHGSPHKFDKFDLSKMGTGEGAQAYGWGGYVAENPNVAREYTPIDINVSPARALADDELDAWSKAYATMLDMKGDKTKAIESLRKQEKIWQRKQSTPINADAAKWQIPRIRQAIGLVSDDVTKVTQGNANLYELDLRWPDAAREAADPMGPQHFLDWDKPLKEQSEAVRASVRKANVRGVNVDSGESSARDLLDNLVRGKFNNPAHAAGAERASKTLRDAGIPGIRYLDAGSRGPAGNGRWKLTFKDGRTETFNFKPNDDVLDMMGAKAEPIGTANYVFFDDSIVDLLKRNGIPIPKGK